MPDDFDIQKHLNLVELDQLVKPDDSPSLKLLQLLVKHHVTHVAYQNLDLLVQRSEVDLTPSALQKRLLVEKRGGMCYESCELMHRVLLEFKFDARRVASFSLTSQQPYTPGADVDNHHIIIVHLEGKMYLVDAGFGYNSIRAPLEFNFEETEEKLCLPFEKYLLECNEDHYAIRMWLKDAWAPFYRFQRPLVYLNDDQCLEKYREFLHSPQLIPIRDSVLKIGIVTETGRRGISCKFDSTNLKGSPPYTEILIHNSNMMQSENVDFARFRQSINKFVSVPVDENHFENV